MVTRNDVARLAGTSPAVVSYVINNGPRPVSESTRSRVLAAVAELGYRPNAVARSLRSRRTWTIGVISSDGASGKSPFFGEFARACEDAAWECGYSVLLGNSAEDPRRAEGYVRTFLERQVDGLVLMRVRVGPQEVKEMEARGIPVVTIDHEAPAPFSRLAVDDEEGGFLATAHLVEHGHARIGFVGGPRTLAPVALRERGWRRALEAAGREAGESLVAEDELSLEGGYAAAMRLLGSPRRPTAVFASIDHQAIGAMRAAADLGLRVPHDVAVAGFDGAREAAYTVPGLTTIQQPIDAMARYATEILIGAVEAGGGEPVERIFPARLVTRGSCGCPEPRTAAAR
ncbi:LacI family transcriptional regulator [Thermocatellispora tengchongensis]|uniref:LacI family transcriptional regulator n=1 Tax=Thermocatellispora tengchongensis TaxID=1073253 RepID=A0A840PQI3_9ACTN|nr:LacI family DNA-binding transcriptional regulator [Thermocatellispora tengchongensis]MBB5140031.1 LacI family transcriptional regulator [Thermocatellispora tengchongensis]